MSGPVDPEPEWRRRQRLARVFGDDAPEQTREDAYDAELRGGSDESPTDRWLKSQVPPHHGG